MNQEKDLSKFDIRTDLVLDMTPLDNQKTYIKDDITVTSLYLDNDDKSIDKTSGYYTTISFKDVTDTKNYNRVKDIFIKEFKAMLKKEHIKNSDTCMVVGLGNIKSTPDSLGVKTSDGVIITKHIYDLYGTLEEGFRITSRFNPGVMASSGIETSDALKSMIELVNPSFIVVIDALSSSSVDRVCKTIQITNAGINPGSGVGNKRKEISKEIIKRPVIAVGIPTVVSASTIVSDTINYMEKHLSYNIKNKDSKINKLIPSSKINYLKEQNLKLTDEEKKYYFGKIGSLNDYEMKELVTSVLTPIGYNLMVTPKEVDFLIDTLSKLLSEGINSVLHHQTTKY